MGLMRYVLTLTSSKFQAVDHHLSKAFQLARLLCVKRLRFGGNDAQGAQHIAGGDAERCTRIEADIGRPGHQRVLSEKRVKQGVFYDVRAFLIESVRTE